MTKYMAGFSNSQWKTACLLVAVVIVIVILVATRATKDQDIETVLAGLEAGRDVGNVLDSTAAGRAAALFSIKHGQHPRLYLDQDRLDLIKTASLDQGSLSLDRENFPQVTGALSFEVYIEAESDSDANKDIFDRHDPTRNNLFIRYCPQENISSSLRCLQIAFQSSEFKPYIAKTRVYLQAGHWNTIKIAWDTSAFFAEVQVNDEPTEKLAWQKNNEGAFYDWRPDGQAFRFSQDMELLDSVRIHNEANFSTDSLLTDASQAGGSILAPDSSVISRAWTDTYVSAYYVARSLIEGRSSIDVATAQPSAIKNNALLLGLGYHITNDEQFMTAANVYIDQLVGVIPRTLGGDYTQGGRIEAMGILYDWFFSELSYRQKDNLALAIKETIPLLSKYICGAGNAITTNWDCEQMPAYPDALSGHSYPNNKGVTAGLLAIIDEHPELAPLLDIQHRNFSENYDAVRAWVGVDGGYHQGWSYGSTNRSLDSTQLWVSATNDSDVLRSWQGKVIDYYIYGLRGDMTFPKSGDGIETRVNSPSIAPFALWAAQNFGNTYAQDFYNRLVMPALMGVRLGELLYWKPMISADPIEGLELARHFRNSGSVLMRDTWDYKNATLMEFKSASFSSKNHQHLDQNSFTLFYKSPLLIDSGYYDGYGSNHWHNYYTRTIAHNSITVFDSSEQFSRNLNSGPTCCSNDGGQKFMTAANPTLEQIMPGGTNALDGIVGYKNTGTYSYTKGNASKAYSSEKLDQTNGFVREIVFLRDEVFWDKPIAVVFDKVTATKNKAKLKKRLILHMVNEPTPLQGWTEGPGIHDMEDPLVVIQNGEGLVYSQTVLPVDPTIRKIGGKNADQDYRFLVPTGDDGASYELDSGRDGFSTSLKDSNLESADMGSWRIEIMAGMPEEREYFLHVFSVADVAGSNGPPSAVNFSTDGVAAVLLGGRKMVAFNKSDVQTSVLEIPYTGVRPDILLAGVAPNESYSLLQKVNRSTNEPYVVVTLDANGALASDSSGLLDIASNASATMYYQRGGVEPTLADGNYLYPSNSGPSGDFDDDGVINKLDNCWAHPNTDQADRDGDGRGDPCNDAPPGC